MRISFCSKLHIFYRHLKVLVLLHAFNGLYFQHNVGKPAPEKQTILDFTGARDDVTTVVSAGPYANHLHLAPDKWRRQYLITQFFYRPDAFPAIQPTASKHWRHIDTSR